MALKTEDFEYISHLLKQQIGLVLTPDKEYLLESRLLPVARMHGINSLPILFEALRRSPPPGLLTEVLEAMTTNESLFFRDIRPFEQLQQVLLPMLRGQAGSRRNLRIWSAACSTGQEPYSVAMTLREENPSPADWQYNIIATDVAQKVLERAEKGVFSQFEVQRGLPIQMLLKYFDSLPDTSWRVRENIRDMVVFRQLNLLSDFTAMGKCDLILCRNVLIYFDEATRMQIVQRMAQQLQPGGVLMLGGTEALLKLPEPLTPLDGMHGTYRLKS